MGIRIYKKDHLRVLAQPAALVPPTVAATGSISDDPLRFWTKNPDKPVLVDLHVFKDGEYQKKTRGGSWLGPFSGRPNLIVQLAPAIRELFEYAAPNTITQYLHAFRTWWRLFDAVEKVVTMGNISIAPVSVVSEITEVHRQHAYDEGMDRLPFTNFIRIVNLARKANGLRKLYWSSPEREDPRRHLPPKRHTDKIRFALRRIWLDAVYRWEKTEELMRSNAPSNEKDAALLCNYQKFQLAVRGTGNPKPNGTAIYGGMSASLFNNSGYSVPTMLRGFYPDARDIRAAFHLCLADTGWNPSVLLSINVEEKFLVPHPKDPLRYLMYGHKARGDSEQITEGLFKSRGSPGIILQILIQRTQPLREQLHRELAKLRKEFEELKSSGSASEMLDEKHMQIVKLEEGSRSPWLYAVPGRGNITWLDEKSYHRGVDRTQAGNFLDELVERINQKQPPNEQVSKIKPSDFRDAFAAYAYRISGGMVLYVMKALGHKSPGVTKDYLNNTLLNDESDKLYRTYSNAFWHEVKYHGRVDPTIIAKWCRDGDVTEEERKRLSKYRSLRRSRIGVGCKDPTNPPKHIAPTFKADGQSMCHVQRCTLCLEHAVIFPDSISGLAKRLAELRHIRTQMSAVAFSESSFGKELENTRLALKHFDAQEAQALLASWEQHIASGKHRVIEFEGIPSI
jgi:hypothetical protein